MVCMGTLRSPHEAPRSRIAPHPKRGGSIVSSPTSISLKKFPRLVGTAKAPAIIDVRTDEDFDADPRLIPGSIRRNFADASKWAAAFSGREAVVVCQRGMKLSEGTAAWLRLARAAADTLEGGFEAWAAAGLPLVPAAQIPPRDDESRTVWVTRSRP